MLGIVVGMCNVYLFRIIICFFAVVVMAWDYGLLLAAVGNNRFTGGGG